MMRLSAAFALLSLAGVHHLEAQDLPGAKKSGDKPAVKILSVKPEKTDVATGETVKVAFELEIPKGWHIYAAGKKPLFGLPTKFKLDNAEVAGAITEPPLKVVNEPGIGDIDFHEGKITVTVPLRLKADVRPGPVTVTGKITYQICDPNVCVDNSTAISFDLKALADAGAPPGLTPPGEAAPRLGDLKLVSVTSSKADVKVGEPFVVTVAVEVPAGYHIYPVTKTTTGQLTVLKLKGAELAGKPEGPPTKTHPPVGEEPAYEYYDGAVTLKYPMRLKDGATPGPVELTGKLSYQICTEKICRPTSTPVSLTLTVKEGKADVDAAPSGPKELQEGLVKFLVIAVLGGLASLLQPCVFPLMPVTITYFIKQADGSRAKSVFLSVAYAIGLILSFTTIGIIFSLALGADGARIFATKWYVNVIVAALFLWFGFSLFGFYDISLPSWLVGGLTNKRRQGAGGSFILGMLFSVVTFTCTVPIAGLILAASASSDSHTRFMGIVGMLVYSSVMAVPFIVMGVFPSLITTVRKSSGDWLDTTKTTMGFIELPVAIFYLSKADTVAGIGILTRGVMIAIWVLSLGVTILYLLRVFQGKGQDGEPSRRRIGIPRLVVAALASVLLVSFAMGYDGRPLGWLDGVLPPNTAHETPGHDAALAEAKKTGKPVFLEFTGVTCTNCQVMKGTVLASPAVKELTAKFIFAELYTDRQDDPKHAAGDEENRKLLVDKYQGFALPFYMTLGPDGVERSRILGKVSEAEFIEFLKKGLQAPAGAPPSGGN